MIRPETTVESFWPQWPQWDERTLEAVRRALTSSRWTISWPTRGETSLERQFARAFADYNGAKYCVSVDHGSSALLVALQALDVGPGDEVIVPNETWVATATSALRAGATPILADVDPVCGCLTWESIEACITERTRAVIVVHLASSIADIRTIVANAHRRGIVVVEDCAQAHGAIHNGQRVGTFGDIGAFSFQQGKVLAAGEGGAAITNNADLYLRMQELRADGRSYSKSIAPSGEEISATGGISGANFCMTEVSAAILLDQLPKLDDQHRIRASAVSALIDTVDSSIHISTAPLPGSADQCSIYELALTINPIEFGLQSSAEVASKITEVLGFPVWAPDVPLSEDPLYRPDTNPLYRHAAAGKVWNLVEYPGVKAYRQNTLLLHHAALLAGEAGGRRIGEAINTVARRSKGGNS